MDYSHYPLKKRPVHFVECEYIKDETVFDNTDECLEPENLSTKPLDLSMKIKSEPIVVVKRESPPPYEQHENAAGDHHPATTQAAVAAYHHHSHLHYAPVPAQYPSAGYLSGYMYQHGGSGSAMLVADRAYPVYLPAMMAVARDASLSPPGTAGRTGSAFEPLVQLTSPGGAVTPMRSPPAAVPLSWFGRTAVSGWSPSSEAMDASPSYGPPHPSHPSYQQTASAPQQQYQLQLYSGGSDTTTASSSVGGGDAQMAAAVKRESSSVVVAARYKCAACAKTYSTASGLTKHQQYHSKSTATRRTTRSSHIRTHTGEKPCICKLCGKAFSRPWLLQCHIRTHTGEKPFSCQHCDRAFANRSNLRAHLQTHSDVEYYSCPTCSKTFSRMSLLTKHRDTGCPRLLPQHQQQQQAV